MKEKNQGSKTYFYYAGLGIDLVVSTFVGGAIGYFLDKWLGTGPWLLIVFIILGAISGFLTIYKTLERMEEKK